MKKEKIGELKIEKPIEVLFEGADLNIYKKTPKIHETVLEELKDIKGVTTKDDAPADSPLSKATNPHPDPKRK